MFRQYSRTCQSEVSRDGKLICVYTTKTIWIYTSELVHVDIITFSTADLYPLSCVTYQPVEREYPRTLLYSNNKIVNSFRLNADLSTKPQVTVRTCVTPSHRVIIYGVPKKLRDLFVLDNRYIKDARHKCLLILKVQDVLPADMLRYICYLLCHAVHADYRSYCVEVKDY